MLLSELSQDITTLRGIGGATAGRLAKLEVRGVRDLLLHLPRGYEDRRSIVPLAHAAAAEKACVVVTVVSQQEMGRTRLSTLKVVVTDGLATASLVCFGRAFLRTTLQPGRKFFVWGSFKPRFGELQSTDFELEPWSGDPAAFGKVLPVYPLTEGLAQGAVRRAVQRALESTADVLEDELPEALARAHGFPRKGAALATVHFPDSLESAERARNALAYEELFWFELQVMRKRLTRAVKRRSRGELRHELTDRLLARLAFSLTEDQRSATAEIEKDLSSDFPMARLLQGDVGCGKTLVALLSALLLTARGEQVAFIAPTELLARQHAENAARLLEPIGVRIAFLSGAVTAEARALLLGALAAGEIDILFATHALFSADVIFRALGLVVVDEQHKFGVAQRAAALAKGANPDLLLMTATPIPRTLALTAFGDLDVSTIRTMPAGRKPVITHLAREGNEEKVYRRVREEIGQGRQAYFVYPLIEGSESLAVKDAESSYQHLCRDVYPDLRLALIHSRVSEEEKLAAMKGFAAGAVDILVATSVVEVGVDVANATCMVVEHAERFGLSTLHQLRGRVGRGPRQSYAFLVYGRNLTAEGVERLKIMMETTDGFRVAERDLELRGPGELLGMRQSGFLRFRVADLSRHASLLIQARDDARAVLSRDPGFLEPGNAPLRRVLAAAPPFADSFLEAG